MPPPRPSERSRSPAPTRRKPTAARSERTCAGCGRKALKSELVRFVGRAGELISGPHEPGRGVYTCRRLACFERAAARRAFSRVLRQTVRVSPLLARLYTDD